MAAAMPGAGGAAAGGATAQSPWMRQAQCEVCNPLASPSVSPVVWQQGLQRNAVWAVLAASTVQDVAQGLVNELLTYRASTQLANNMQCRTDAYYQEKPDDRCVHAHHIVPYRDARYYGAAESRAILAQVGIDLNSAANGVWMECDRHMRMHNDPVRAQLYYKSVHELLEKSNPRNRETVAGTLAFIRLGILSGRFPWNLLMTEGNMSPFFQNQEIYCLDLRRGFTPTINGGNALTAEQEFDLALIRDAQVPRSWDPGRWKMSWFRSEKVSGKPDWDMFSGVPICSAQLANRLWPNGVHEGLELLPISMGGDSWFFVMCTQTAAVDVASSSVFFWWSPEEQEREKMASAQGQESHLAYLAAKSVFEPILNVIDPSVAAFDFFRVSNPYHPCDFWSVYCTERFKSRCEALGLKGMSFWKAGYIVDGPANAVMPRKLEPPKQELPRWTQAREADPESLHKLKQAGQHWYAQQGFGVETDGLTIVRAIEAVVNHHGQNQHKLKKAAWAQLELELQGAWGLLLEWDLGWQWLEVAVGMRTYALAVQTPNASHAHCLSQVVAKQFRRAPETTLELTYNMLKAGDLPPGEAGQRVCLG